MRRANGKAVLVMVSGIILLAGVASCNFFGAFSNPLDPLSDSYQGFMSVALSDLDIGDNHVLATRTDGTLLAWGNNEWGSLGNGTDTDSHSPVEVLNLSDPAVIRAGDNFSLAVDMDGVLWGWGRNKYHELGTDSDGTLLTKREYRRPVRLREGILTADGENSFAAAIDIEGNVSIWGCFGISWIDEDSDEWTAELQILVPETLPLSGDLTAVDLVCRDETLLVLASDSTVWRWTPDTEVFERLSALENIEFIDGNLAVASDGTLWEGTISGYPETLSITTSGVSSASGTDDRGLAVTDDGELYGWGDNTFGVLGLPFWIYWLDAPYRIDGFYGDHDFTDARVFFENKNAFVCLADDAFFVWGENGEGQLGVGTRFAPTYSLDRFAVDFGDSSVSIINADGGENLAVALDSEGHLWSWGKNDCGQLGLGDTTFRLEPEKVSSSETFTGLSVGNKFVSALAENSILWSWGRNDLGQLGTGDTNASSVPVAGLTSVASFCCGGDHSLASTLGGILYAWGKNESGQLGLGDTANRTSPEEVAGIDASVAAVSCGSNHSIALDVSGNVWTWGENENGQLGDGTTVDKTEPYMLSSALFGGRPVVAIEGGERASFAITDDGCLWGWGEADCVGYGGDSEIDTSLPVQVLDETDIDEVASMGYGSLIVRRGDTICMKGVDVTLSVYEGEQRHLEDGAGNETDISPRDLWSGRGIEFIRSGGSHAFLIDSNGVLYSF